jgi:hypothetical protein
MEPLRSYSYSAIGIKGFQEKLFFLMFDQKAAAFSGGILPQEQIPPAAISLQLLENEKCVIL